MVNTLTGNILTADLDSIRAKVNKLDFDLKTEKYTISEYCSKIKNAIDTQAETLIQRIHYKRQELFDEIEEHEKRKMSEFEKEFNSEKYVKLIEETRDSLERYSLGGENGESSLGEEPSRLAKDRLRKLEEKELDFRIEVSRNRLVDFEAISLPDSKLLGLVYYKKVHDQSVTVQAKTEKRTLEYDMTENPLTKPFTHDPEPIIFDLVWLQNGKLLADRLYANGNRQLSILSSDMKFVEKTRYFLQYFRSFTKLEPAHKSVITTIDKIVFFVESPVKNGQASLFTLDYELNVLSNTKLECESLVDIACNEKRIFCMPVKMGEFFFDHIKCYDFNLNLHHQFDSKMMRKEEATCAFISGFAVDQSDRMFLVYKSRSFLTHVKILQLNPENTLILSELSECTIELTHCVFHRFFVNTDLCMAFLDSEKRRVQFFDLKARELVKKERVGFENVENVVIGSSFENRVMVYDRSKSNGLVKVFNYS